MPLLAFWILKKSSKLRKIKSSLCENLVLSIFICFVTIIARHFRSNFERFEQFFEQADGGGRFRSGGGGCRKQCWAPNWPLDKY